jgi:CheY-like chemotaxis protein
VAFVDIALPGFDGYEVARRIREALGGEVLLIAVTGYGQLEDRERSKAAGFDLHLVKPVDAEIIRHVLDGVEPDKLDRALGAGRAASAPHTTH